jgi:hypothetical protein
VYGINTTPDTAITLGYLGGDKYGITGFTIDTSGFTPSVTIKYEFRATDNHGNTSTMPTMFAFMDNFGCTAP